MSGPRPHSAVSKPDVRLVGGGAFRTLWSSVGLANLADGIFQVVLPVVLIVHGAAPTAVPLVLGATRLPWAVLALHAGLLVDRLDRRLLLGISYFLRGTAITIIAIAVAIGWPLVPIAVLCALCVGAAETIGDTAAHSLTPSLVPKQDLVRANGILQSTELSANLLIGPACAGLIAAISPVTGLVVVGCAYALAAASSWSLGPRPVVRDPEDGARLTDGLKILFRTRRLWMFAATVGTINLAYAIFQSALPLKVVGSAHDNTVILGLYWGASGLVCLILGTIVQRLVPRIGALATLLIGICGMAFGFSAGGFTANRWLLGVAVAMTGSLVLVNVVTVSYRQSVVPSSQLGRVTAAYRLIAFGAFPVGSLVAGICIERLGIMHTLLVTLIPTGVAAIFAVLAYRRGGST